MLRFLLIGLLTLSPLTVRAAGPTVYASGINDTAGAGISSFNAETGLSTQNVAFSTYEVSAQVTADGAKAAYVGQTAPGSYGLVVYAMQSGVLLGTIPLAANGNLVLSPDSAAAYVNTTESGMCHVIEVNLDSLTVVLDVAYSSYTAGSDYPIAVSADGATVFTEDAFTIFALDAITLEITNSTGGGLLTMQVTPDGKYLFGLNEINGSPEAIQFLYTSTLATAQTITFPRVFKGSALQGLAISGDSSTIVVLGVFTNFGQGAYQPIGIVNLVKGTFTDTLLPDFGYNAVALSRNGSRVYLGDLTGLVSTFDPQTFAVTPQFAAAAPVATLQVGPNGLLYAGYLTGVAAVMAADLGTNQLTHTFALPTGYLSAFTILKNAGSRKLYASGGPTLASAPQFSVQRFGPAPSTGTVYNALAWNADQSGIWAGGPYSLDLLDPSTLAVRKSIPLGGGTVALGINGLLITPDQTKALITYGRSPTQQEGSGVLVIDLANGDGLARVPLYAPRYMRISPSGGLAYITSVQLGMGNPRPYYPEILVFDLTTYQLVREFSVPISMNHEPLSLAISEDGNTLYTTVAGKVFALNAADGSVIWSVTPGVETIQVATIPGSTDLITSDHNSPNLSRLSSTGKVIETINVGGATTYLTVLPN